VLDYHNELDYHNNLHCTLQTYHDADVFCGDLFHDLFRESYHHHVVICVSLTQQFVCFSPSEMPLSCEMVLAAIFKSNKMLEFFIFALDQLICRFIKRMIN